MLCRTSNSNPAYQIAGIWLAIHEKTERLSSVPTLSGERGGKERGEGGREGREREGGGRKGREEREGERGGRRRGRQERENRR